MAQEQTLPKFLKRIYSCHLQFRTQLMPPPPAACVLLEPICSSPRGECWHRPSAQRPVFQPSVFWPIHSCGYLLALVSGCLNSVFSPFVNHFFLFFFLWQHNMSDPVWTSSQNDTDGGGLGVASFWTAIVWFYLEPQIFRLRDFFLPIAQLDWLNPSNHAISEPTLPWLYFPRSFRGFVIPNMSNQEPADK